MNNGFCDFVPSELRYECICPDGYKGVNCDILINPCSSNPCVNGQCFDVVMSESNKMSYRDLLNELQILYRSISCSCKSFDGHKVFKFLDFHFKRVMI